MRITKRSKKNANWKAVESHSTPLTSLSTTSQVDSSHSRHKRGLGVLYRQ
jgi:hypothetical protein